MCRHLLLPEAAQQNCCECLECIGGRGAFGPKVDLVGSDEGCWVCDGRTSCLSSGRELGGGGY